MWTPMVVLAGMGLCSGLGLGAAARLFAVETDPRQERILDALPGANCGGCGYAGCADFAAAVTAGRTAPADCPVCDAAARGAIADVMGLEAVESVRSVALVLCQGGWSVADKLYRYNGQASCASAALLGGGDKLCNQGCLGLGDCQTACAFDAVEITDDGIARVIPERCTGCGRCVTACPKGIIRLVPEDAPTHVLCSNTDKGAAARKACGVSCLGCRKCEKAFADEPRITVSDLLARVDYTHPPCDAAVLEACPTGALVRRDLRAAAADRPRT